MSTSWHHILAISAPVHIEIYRVGDNRGPVNTSTTRPISDQLGTKTYVKYCYVDLSSWYGFWFAILCIDMNIILYFSIAVQQFRDGKWVNTENVFFLLKYDKE